MYLAAHLSNFYLEIVIKVLHLYYGPFSFLMINIEDSIWRPVQYSASFDIRLRFFFRRKSFNFFRQLQNVGHAYTIFSHIVCTSINIEYHDLFFKTYESRHNNKSLSTYIKQLWKHSDNFIKRNSRELNNTEASR